MQKTRGKCEDEKWQSEDDRERDHPDERHFPITLCCRDEEASDEGRRAREGRQRERQSHKQRADVRASLSFLAACERVELCKKTGRNCDLVKSKQVECKEQKDRADHEIDPRIRGEQIYT